MRQPFPGKAMAANCLPLLAARMLACPMPLSELAASIPPGFWFLVDPAPFGTGCGPGRLPSWKHGLAWGSSFLSGSQMALKKLAFHRARKKNRERLCALSGVVVPSWCSRCSFISAIVLSGVVLTPGPNLYQPFWPLGRLVIRRLLLTTPRLESFARRRSRQRSYIESYCLTRLKPVPLTVPRCFGFLVFSPAWCILSWKFKKKKILIKKTFWFTFFLPHALFASRLLS